MLYSDMFRLARVIIRLSLTIFKVYKVTVHIWYAKRLTWVLLILMLFCSNILLLLLLLLYKYYINVIL